MMEKQAAENLAKNLFKKRANERINRKLPPSLCDAVPTDDLVIEDDGTPSPLAPVGEGKIIFKPCNENTGEPMDAQAFNLVARERLERQISDLMAKVNQSVKERNYIIKDALDVLELARTAVYTHPMGEVSVNLHEAARRFSDLEPKFSRATNSLGNLAMEIRQSEQVRENNC
jgi:hypothetical protein